MRSEEYALFLQTAEKLRDFCAQADLDFRLDCGRYPVTLTLSPGPHCRQMSLLGDEAANPDAYIALSLDGGEIRVTAVGAFTISADALQKIKTLFDKLSRYWTQYVFQMFAQEDADGLPGVTLGALWRRAEGALTDVV